MEKNMNTKTLLFNVMLTATVVANPTFASENKTRLQVAIVNGSIGSDKILSGDLDEGIKKIMYRRLNQNDYDKHMGLCVAYLKNKEFVLSESSCTDAIKYTRIVDLRPYYKALAYSNRGVSRYLNNDLNGAINDLRLAKSIDVNSITETNLTFIERLSSQVNNKL
jgi:Flp pilus assembly protein TadD